MEKGEGWKTSRMTPLPKRGFGPPLLRYVFHPPQVSVLCFSCTKIHDRADQKLFWRGPKIFGRARSLVRFPPPPIRFAPPHITAQKGVFFFFFEKAREQNSGEMFRRHRRKFSPEKRANFFAVFRPSISRQSGSKKFHEKSSTNSPGQQANFFLGVTLGVGAPNRPLSKIEMPPPLQSR